MNTAGMSSVFPGMKPLSSVKSQTLSILCLLSKKSVGGEVKGISTADFWRHRFPSGGDVLVLMLTNEALSSQSSRRRDDADLPLAITTRFMIPQTRRL